MNFLKQFISQIENWYLSRVRGMGTRFSYGCGDKDKGTNESSYSSSTCKILESDLELIESSSSSTITILNSNYSQA